MASHPTAQKMAPGPIAVVHETRAKLRPHGEVTSVEHVLTYLARGQLRMGHGSSIEIQPGTVTVIPAGVRHSALDGHDVEFWQVRFCASCFQLVESQLLMSPFRAARRGALPVVNIAESRRPLLVHRFGELAHESRNFTPESPQMCRALLLLMLGEVRRSMGKLAIGARAGSLAGDALEFIQGHCFAAISLRDVAAAVHRTPAHVATSVKSATGFSVGDWILSARTAEAATCLAHTDDRIEEIGRRVGWRDTTHFIRQFKKVYGLTPSAWRLQNRAQHMR